jgi:hypothetical protein
MKKSIAFAGLTALAMASASAQDFYQHGITLAIKGYAQGNEAYSESESASKNVYTYKSKFVAGKFSNKEFLQALVSAEVISDIKGWSLSLVTDSNGNNRGLYIVKKGAEPINVSGYAGFDRDEIAQEYNDKEVTFPNGNRTYDSTWTERGLSGIFINVPGFNAELHGSYFSSHSSKYSENQSLETESYVEKLHSASFTNLVGALDYYYDLRNKGVKAPIETAFLEGSVAVGAPKATDIVVDSPQ